MHVPSRSSEHSVGDLYLRSNVDSLLMSFLEDLVSAVLTLKISVLQHLREAARGPFSLRTTLPWNCVWPINPVAVVIRDFLAPVL